MLRKKYAVILSASEGSRMTAHGVLFTGFFVAVLLRMTEGRERAVGDAGPYNHAGSPAVACRGWRPRQPMYRSKKYAVILSASEGSRMVSAMFCSRDSSSLRSSE